MSVELTKYHQDGADEQARAVLAFLGDFEIPESYDRDIMSDLAKPTVARWENCREQGYVISLDSNHNDKQINIAFFKHRNSDSIHAIMWEQLTMNSPTIGTAKFGDIYKDKYDTSYSVSYGEVVKMAVWIEDRLREFWIATKEK